MPLLARLARDGKERGLTMHCGNNLGYYGPFESVIRGNGDDYHWAGCSAGQNVIGIEADGTIKGCPSLATAHFSGGNIRDLSLEDIWNWSERIHFTRTRTAGDLWGYCQDCYYADVCRAGCTWTSHSLTGRTGNNPYCYYRASELDKIGVRERIVKTRDADKSPFAIGEFDIITEAVPGREAVAASHGIDGPRRQVPERLVQLEVPAPRPAEPPKGYLPPKLELCGQCRCHYYRHETACPHCGAAAPWTIPPPDVRPAATV
jgi:radical SAM protein with 4Fe4S-binding SPASM domain